MEKEQKTELVSKFALRKGDTGSTEVQVALLTEQINNLTTHMVANKHDYQAQRSLLLAAGKRRRFLSHLSKEDVVRYHSLIKRLGLRK